MNSLSEEYKDIRNTLEYRRENLTVDIIIFALKNKEFELKTKFKDYKIDEKLYIKEKLIQSKKINRCNFNSFKKGKSLNQKFKDKNKNQVKTKNYVRKCYYFGKARHLINDCFKKISDMKERNNIDDSIAIVCKNDPTI